MENTKKQLWIDHSNRLLSFHAMPNGTSYSAEEEDFWAYVLELFALGYRVQ